MFGYEGTAQACSQCGVSHSEPRCPNCGQYAVVSRQAIAQAQKPYIWLSVGALASLLISVSVYPLLDGTRVILLGLAVFFASFLFHFRGVGKSFLYPDLARAKMLQAFAGIALFILAALVFCNGALDRTGEPTETTLIAKQASQGRHGSMRYSLVVSSWRPGRDTEKLQVDEKTYRQAVEFQTITVSVHDGYFGWPWYDHVSVLDVHRQSSSGAAF